MPNVYDHEELYNVIRLGGAQGKASPGKVTLSGHDRKIVWDVQFGPYLSGARTPLKGIPPIEFSASFYLVKDVAQGIDDFAAWDAFVPLLKATAQVTNSLTGQKQTQPKAIDIYHPDLAANEINSVVLASLGGMVYDGKGGGTIVVKFQEYKPPKSYGGTPIGSKRTGPDPNVDMKDAVQQVTVQYQSTAWG
jgi:hypothetical protein